MAQRIFDVDDPQDVKDLFDLFPDVVQRIEPTATGFIKLYSADDKNLETVPWLRVLWHAKTEITRPVDETQWIGTLCWFWDNGEPPVIGILDRIATDVTYKYINTDEETYKCCRPVCRNEVKFADDEK